MTTQRSSDASRVARRGSRRWPGALLWLLAVAVMLGSAVYQRRTGPTRPLRGEFAAAGQQLRYELPRTELTVSDARVELPDPGDGATGRLWYKRLGTDDPFKPLPLVLWQGRLVASLPAQPPAGKLEYYLLLREPSGAELRIPQDPGETVVIRFKGEVPWPVLLSHVLLMFFSVLIGVRAGLGALLRPRGIRPLAWSCLAGITVGGMILGPVVQKYAFGAFWTGFPLGYDLTDNKALIMWLVWIGACAVAGFRPGQREATARLAVLAAALIMIGVYLIPHSLRGSTLDYEQLDRGVPAEEAIKTG